MISSINNIYQLVFVNATQYVFSDVGTELFMPQRVTAVVLLAYAFVSCRSYRNALGIHEFLYTHKVSCVPSSGLSGRSVKPTTFPSSARGLPSNMST